MELLVRFLLGGLVVSVFALVGSLFKPTSFGGLFGAAPSVALATIGLKIVKHGPTYARIECRSMIAGGIALAIYSCAVIQLLMRFKMSAVRSTASSTLIWLVAAFGLWEMFLHR